MRPNRVLARGWFGMVRIVFQLDLGALSLACRTLHTAFGAPRFPL
jgi:hypothetical protein